MYSTQYVVDQSGATARQLNHWSDKGWLSGAEDKPGTGHSRAWSSTDLNKATLMVRLMRSGFRVEKAHVIANAIVGKATGEGARVRLGDNLWLIVKGL